MSQKKRATGLITALLCLMLALGACSGGGGKGNSEATATPGASTAGETSQPSKSAAAPDNPYADKLTLKVFNAGSWAGGTPFPPREKDVQRQMMEAAVNIDLQMTVPQAGEDISKLNTLLAAGDIPDLIFFNDRVQAVNYYQEGLIAELDDALADFPKLKQHFSESQWEAMKFKGKTIGTPGLELVSGINGWWVRNDWLQKLGLSVPTTTEELFEVMRAFTFDDPDGNGVKDTYGFIAGVPKDGNISNPAVQQLGLNGVMWLFGVNPHKFDIEGDRIVNHNTDPRMKEAVAFVNRMVTEQVIDPDWVTISEAGAKEERIEKGNIGVVYNDWRMMDEPERMFEVAGEVIDWVSIPPVQGPDGNRILGELAFQNNLWAVSAKAAGDPEKLKRILAFLEYWYTDEEAYPYFSYGDKDVFWQYGANNEIVRLTVEQEVADAYKYNIHYRMPRRADDPLYFNFKKLELTSAAHRTNIEHSIPPKPSVLLVPGTDDTLYQDRMKYINEMLLRFIYGREPIDNWDAYIRTLEDTYQLKAFEANAVEQFKEQGLMP